MNIEPQKKKRGQGIAHVSDLFAKYTKVLKAPQGVVVTECIEVIHDLFGVTISKDQCTYAVASKTLSLRVSGMIKTEILLRKKEVLNHLRARLGDKSAPQEIL